MKLLSRTTLAIAFGLFLLNCASAGNDKTATNAQLEFDGQVTRVPLEGGFWGIVDAAGKHYDPGRLAPEFQRDGLKVHVIAHAESGRISFRMWGTPITIEKIEVR